ncbi:MAG: hypothetical protein VKL42_04035 [Snowella sp.]|nr:hypothetical protein [Snowella sp.]
MLLKLKQLSLQLAINTDTVFLRSPLSELDIPSERDRFFASGIGRSLFGNIKTR